MTKPFLSVADLRYIAPKARYSIIRGIIKSYGVLEDYGIANSRLRLAHFLAQAALETAGFRTLNEYGSTSYFRRRYGRRRDLGNRSRADGATYHGRGIFQLTGRANYRRYGRLIKVDLENRPQLAARPDISLKIACAYWNSKKLSRYADANNIRRITKRINGGYNGLQGRRRYFARAMKVLADKEFAAPPSLKARLSAALSPRRLLKRGMFGSDVKKMQQSMQDLGFRVEIDGIFGSVTRKTLLLFQKRHALRADGIAGSKTQELLARLLAEAKPRPSSPNLPKTNLINRSRLMTDWKPFLKSRTLWANLIGFVALLLDIFGMPSLAEEDQKTLIDSILKLVEASGFLAGAFFRYIAQEKLSL